MIAVVAVLTLGQVVVLVAYTNDRAYLARLFDRIASPTLPATKQVENVLHFLREKPASTSDSYFLLPVFGPLRPTARQVAEVGGDCADRSRLLIVLLRIRGIKATKWALYVLRPQHAVVEVEIESGKMAVDPLFGLCFPRSHGGYFGIDELKENPQILPARIRYLRSLGQQPGAARLDRYPLDKYVYQHARTINWDKSAGMQVLFQILKRLIGEKAYEIPRPSWVEEPALMVMLGLSLPQGGILVALFVKRRSTLRKRRAN